MHTLYIHCTHIYTLNLLYTHCVYNTNEQDNMVVTMQPYSEYIYSVLKGVSHY